MATADTTMDSKLLQFLFKQLFGIWYPDIRAIMAQRPVGDFTWLKRTPKLQTPPLISTLVSLADVPDVPEAKKYLPCGHIATLREILASSNLFGDRRWRKGPHFFDCPRCDRRVSLPIFPDPWVVDGLQERLNLLEWAWAHSKYAPIHVDANIGRILRYILDQMKRGPQDPEMTPSLPRSEPSQRRQRQMLELIETEAAVLAEGKIYDGPKVSRGTELYCKFRRCRASLPGYARVRYPPPSPGQSCRCKTPHGPGRQARQWASTPAEDEEEWEFAIPRIENAGQTAKSRQKKTVRFAGPVITEIRYFEPWWRDEYRDSDRYYSSGPVRTSVDSATRVDDDREIARLNSERLAAERNRNVIMSDTNR